MFGGGIEGLALYKYVLSWWSSVMARCCDLSSIALRFASIVSRAPGSAGKGAI